MCSGLAYSRRLWLVAHSLGAVSGVWLRLGQTARTGGGTWQRMANATGRGSPTVSPSVERGAAAFAVEAVGGGGLPRRTSQPRRRNNSALGKRFPPFVFSLPPLSDTASPLFFLVLLFFVFLLLFSFSFILLSFLFLLYYFSFLFAFRLFFSLFVFLFYFFFFSLSHFLQPFRRRQGVSLSPLVPLSLLGSAFHNKRPGA